MISTITHRCGHRAIAREGGPTADDKCGLCIQTERVERGEVVGQYPSEPHPLGADDDTPLDSTQLKHLAAIERRDATQHAREVQDGPTHTGL